MSAAAKKNLAGWGASLAMIVGACAAYVWSNRPAPARVNAASPPAVSFDDAVAEMQASARAEPATTQATGALISDDVKVHALGRLGRVDRLLRDYARACGGEFPIGTNADITRALRGDNPKRIIFVTPEEMPVNARGEITDDWQTPYFFHQVSGREMEVFSAGPDREMWTADDLKVTAR